MRFKIIRLLFHMSGMLILVSLSTTSIAQRDIWRDLLYVMRFADINRAQLEFNCRETPLFSYTESLKELCKKREIIPASVMEEAALPYLKLYLTESLALDAIELLSRDLEETISEKLIVEISSGKRQSFTNLEIITLDRRNKSEVGRALSKFATDKQQARAVARAMINYKP